jgi:cell volume regulation protein A
MTVFLSVAFLGMLLDPAKTPASLIPMFFQEMAIGALVGYGAGRAIIYAINHLKLEFEGLYPVLTIAFIVLTYGLTQIAGGSGFLAVYVAGIVLGNGNFLKRKSLILFHDGLAWLMQIAMFLMMGLIVDPHAVLGLSLSGLTLSAFLVFVARPVSVYLCLLPTTFTFREKTMISWGGLRGAVPIILATYPLLAGIPQAQTIFDMVFFVVFTSVLLQGAMLPRMAAWLRVVTPFRPKPRYPLEYVPTGDIKSELVEVKVPVNSRLAGRSLLELRLPDKVLVVLIQRGEEVIVPRGGTVVLPEDSLLVLAERETLRKIQALADEN